MATCISNMVSKIKSYKTPKLMENAISKITLPYSVLMDDVSGRYIPVFHCDNTTADGEKLSHEVAKRGYMVL